MEVNNYFNQESERLQFRQLQEDDIPAWTQFFLNNDRLKYLGIDLNKGAEEHAQDWIYRQLKRYQEEGLGHLAAQLKDSGEFIGVGGIIPRELEDKKEYEIAYSLFPQHWGKGYATELAKTMKEYGCKNLLAKRFISIIDINNTDSAKVAQKNGMSVLFKTTYLGMNVNVYGMNC